MCALYLNQEVGLRSEIINHALAKVLERIVCKFVITDLVEWITVK